MPGTIKANTESIRSASTQLSENASEYNTLVEKLYSIINAELPEGYKSADSTALQQRIESYRPELVKAYTMMMDFSSYLNSVAATKYENTEEENVSVANSLPGGN